jgi:hypothetical protein
MGTSAASQQGKREVELVVGCKEPAGLTVFCFHSSVAASLYFIG